MQYKPIKIPISSAELSTEHNKNLEEINETRNHERYIDRYNVYGHTNLHTAPTIKEKIKPVQGVQVGGGLLHWEKLLQQGEAGRCNGLIWISSHRL